MLSIIAAVAQNNVIGKRNALPWRLSADLVHFKNTTMGAPIIMGHKTFISIGKPLSGRTNIVLTKEPLLIEGCLVAHTLPDAVALAKEHDEAFIIGGAMVYEQALPYTSRLYITHVHGTPEGDIFFPEVHWDEWKEVQRESHPRDEKNEYSVDWCVYERLSAPHSL